MSIPQCLVIGIFFGAMATLGQWLGEIAANRKGKAKL